MLQAAGCVHVDAVENGQEAVEAAKQREYDLILMDIMMPIMGGLEATGHIRSARAPGRKKQVIVALTANAFQEDRDRYLANGMDDVITKPVNRTRLLDLVQQTRARVQDATQR